MDRLLSIETTAQQLGLTPSATREKIAAGKLPAIRMGKLLKVSERQLQEFIASLPQCTASEALTKQWTPKR